MVVWVNGCYMDPPRPSADWNVRLLDGDMEIAACEPIIGDTISGYRENSEGQRWTKFWEASGVLDLAVGETINAAADTKGIETVFYDATVIDSGSAFSIYVHGDEPSASASFVLLPDTPDGYWTGPDGSISAEPCGSDPAASGIATVP
jgi:hypothetical protein